MSSGLFCSDRTVHMLRILALVATFSIFVTMAYAQDERSSGKMTIQERIIWASLPGNEGYVSAPVFLRPSIDRQSLENLRKHGWFNPGSMARWRSSVSDRKGQMAKRWANAGIEADEAINLIIANVRYDDPQAVEWANTRLTNLADWVMTGLDPGEAISWSRTGLTPDKALALARVGVDSQDAARWSEAGIDHEVIVKWAAILDVPQAIEWAKLGFEAEEATQWWNIPDQGAVEAASFRAIGVNATYAQELKDTLCNNSRIEGSNHPDYPFGENIYSQNPYEAAGQCFFIFGVTIQLLDRSTSLVRSVRDRSRLVKVDFSPEPSPIEGEMIFVLGVATHPFRYTTVTGTARIISSVSGVIGD